MYIYSKYLSLATIEMVTHIKLSFIALNLNNILQQKAWHLEMTQF